MGGREGGEKKGRGIEKVTDKSATSTIFKNLLPVFRLFLSLFSGSLTIIYICILLLKSEGNRTCTSIVLQSNRVEKNLLFLKQCSTLLVSKHGA